MHEAIAGGAMSLFVCDGCGVIENTALTPWDGYHGRNMREFRRGDALCSQCHPDSKQWHNKWPRRQYDPERDEDSVVNRPRQAVLYGVYRPPKFRGKDYIERKVIIRPIRGTVNGDSIRMVTVVRLDRADRKVEHMAESYFIKHHQLLRVDRDSKMG